jgi:hypothetical protein
MAGTFPADREPDPTEFNVILEGRPDRPARIPSIRVRQKKPLDADVRQQIVAIIQAVLAHAVAEEKRIQPLIVQVPPTFDSQV